MKQPPVTITVCYLEVVVLPSGEVICNGRTVGWVDQIGKFLTLVPGWQDGPKNGDKD